MRNDFPHGCCTTLSDGRTISVMEIEPGIVSIEIWSPDEKTKYCIDPDQVARLTFPGQEGRSPTLATSFEPIPPTPSDEPKGMAGTALDPYPRVRPPK